MILQGHHTPTHQPTKPAAPHKPTNSKPTHTPGAGKAKAPAPKPSAHKPAAHKPSNTKPPTKSTAARNDVDFELEWIEFAPLAKGGHIH